MGAVGTPSTNGEPEASEAGNPGSPTVSMLGPGALPLCWASGQTLRVPSPGRPLAGPVPTCSTAPWGRTLVPMPDRLGRSSRAGRLPHLLEWAVTCPHTAVSAPPGRVPLRRLLGLLPTRSSVNLGGIPRRGHLELPQLRNQVQPGGREGARGPLGEEGVCSGLSRESKGVSFRVQVHISQAPRSGKSCPTP